MLSSTFPQSLDVITEFADIVQGDSIKLSQFQQAMKDGNFALANGYLTSITDYNKKIINATRLNQMRDAIISIEQFYKTDVEPYIDAKQLEWQATIDKFAYIGTYSPSVLYYKNNIVLYNVNGNDQLYICTNNTTVGILPTNTSYFRQFTVKGNTGNTGGLVTTTFAYDWVNTTAYGTNVIVYYDGFWWQSILSSTNQTPSSTSAYWTQVLKINQPIYPITSVTPTTQSTGELWFKVI